MGLPSLSSILGAVAIGYIAYSIHSMSQIFIVPGCTDDSSCLKSVLAAEPSLTLFLFTSVKSAPKNDVDVDLVGTIEDLDYLNSWEKELNLNLPSSTQNNGTLYLNVVVLPTQAVGTRRWSSLMSNQNMVFTRIPLTQLQVPDFYMFNLLGDKEKEKIVPEVKNLKSSSKPVSHLRSQVTFNIVTDPMSIPLQNIPLELNNKIRLTKGMKYLPIVQYNFLETKLEHLRKIENSTGKVLLKYSPINLGKLRFVAHIEEAVKSLKSLGFSNKDIDDVKNIFSGANLYLLSATIVIVSFHLLFDFLAFKNDISFWRNKSNMEGLSSRTVMWRAFSQAVVFFYLLDEQASMIVLAPSGLGVVIELWKVMKVVNRKKNELSENEKRTNEYDAESMKYLSYLLYPLCIGGAVYSLFYMPHKSWYSWSIHSLVNGVYAFGFLFMLPQLFVNYRMKSVAALPWRSFMYKAFNTFIDDVFAFLITMPAAHRVACFRDDIIFLVYLYQRWLYPVDNTRLDETARALGEKADDSANDKKQN